MSLLSLGGFFTEAVAETWMSIWLSLNSMVYGLISTLYQLFVTVANVSLFSDEVFEQITGRLYVIMGIAMLFIFAYNLILMIINPEEKKSTGQTTKIVKETIISLVLIILLPTIFKYMSIFQYHVLNSGIIGQIILGDSTSEDDCDYADMEMLNTHIDAEKQDVSIGTYCLKGGAGGAAVGAAGGAVVGAVATPVGSGVAGLIGGAGGAIVGCVGGTIVGGVKQIATWFGYKDDQITANLSGACQLYNALPDAEKGARIVAPTIFSAFYHPTKFGYNDCVNYLKTCGDDSGCDYTFDEGNTSSDEIKNGKIDTDDEKKICAFYVYDVDMAKYSGSMSVFNEDSEFINRIKGDEEIFEFNYFLAFLAGGLALWMFFCYTYAIGKRVAKLGFLQIVSPITVMMRIVPKQKEAIFDKWLKELINTYLDVFIRLVIIYFCLFGVSLVPDVISNLFKSASGGFVMASLASVVVILGILQFAQEAPELFKQFFGGGKGNFSLKSPKKQFGENKLAMAGVNAFRGGIYGATTGKGWGRLGGFFSGAGRGAVGGYDKAVKGIDTARTERANGSTWYGRALDRARVGIGMETRAESDDRNIEKVFNTSERKKQNESVMTQIKNVKSHVEEKLERENSKVQFHVTDANGNIVEGNYDSMQKYLKSLQDNVSNATSDADRIKALKDMNVFRDNLGQQKKQAVENMVHALMNGSRVQVDTDANGDPIYAFNENDMSLVQTAVAEINKEIAKGGVGLQYDDNGNVVANSERTSSITSGFDLLNDFKDGIESQSYEIQRHSSNVSQNYSARHADSRMVRGNGQSEKK